MTARDKSTLLSPLFLVLKLLVIFSQGLYSLKAFASWEYQGQLQLQNAVFSDSSETESGSASKDTEPKDRQYTVYAKLLTNYETDSFRLNISGFGRRDFNDESRNMSSLDETYIKLTKESYSLNIGWNIFNWSVLEFFHPVDTINSRNLDVNAERIERLGQPSLIFTKEFEGSFIQLIAFTSIVDPLMPSATNRNGAGTKLEEAQYVIGDNEWENNNSISKSFSQYGIRYQHTFDAFDLDFHWMHKIGNNHPIFAAPIQIIPPELSDIKIYPFYFPVDQVGVAIQGVYEEWLLKLESVNYDFKEFDLETLIPIAVSPGVSTTTITQLDHSISAIGLEYTKHSNNGHQTTFFTEYQFILNTTMEQARALNPFQRDFGFGFRHSFNDFNANEIIAAIIHDVDSYDETVYNIEYSFRFLQNYKFFANLRVIDAPKMGQGLNALSEANGLKPLRDSDNVSFSVFRYF